MSTSATRPKGIVFARAQQAAGPSWSGTSAPRQLAPVANQPIIAHTVHCLARAGVIDVGIVAMPEALPELRAAVGDGKSEGIRITYLELPRPAGPFDALAHCEEFAGGAPSVVFAREGLLWRGLDAFIDCFSRRRPDVLVARQSTPDSTSRGVGLGAVRWLREAGGASERGKEATATGLFIVGPKAFSAARRVIETSSASGDMHTTLDRLARAGAAVADQVVNAWWSYAEDCESLLEGNRLVLDDLVADVHRAALDNVRIQGRVRVHRTARVESTVLRGPVLVGPGARISDAYVGPYTAIGEGVTIDGAEIEDSMILAGASVKHLGHRLESSVIGPGACVARDFSLPRALRLAVGQGAQVSLSC